MRHMFTMILAALLVGCLTPQDQHDPNYPQPEPEMSAYCPQACQQARKLECKFGDDTPSGKTCEQVCKKFTPPSPMGVRPKCMMMAQTCEELDACSY